MDAPGTKQSAIEIAERAGFDMALLESNLALTPGERLRRHDQALQLVLELEKIQGERDKRAARP